MRIFETILLPHLSIAAKCTHAAPEEVVKAALPEKSTRVRRHESLIDVRCQAPKKTFRLTLLYVTVHAFVINNN
jgi:hypothetical protein